MLRNPEASSFGEDRPHEGGWDLLSDESVDAIPEDKKYTREVKELIEGHNKRIADIAALEEKIKQADGDKEEIVALKERIRQISEEDREIEIMAEKLYLELIEGHNKRIADIAALEEKIKQADGDKEEIVALKERIRQISEEDGEIEIMAEKLYLEWDGIRKEHAAKIETLKNGSSETSKATDQDFDIIAGFHEAGNIGDMTLQGREDYRAPNSAQSKTDDEASRHGSNEIPKTMDRDFDIVAGFHKAGDIGDMTLQGREYYDAPGSASGKSNGNVSEPADAAGGSNTNSSSATGEGDSAGVKKPQVVVTGEADKGGKTVVVNGKPGNKSEVEGTVISISGNAGTTGEGVDSGAVVNGTVGDNNSGVVVKGEVGGGSAVVVDGEVDKGTTANGEADAKVEPTDSILAGFDAFLDDDDNDEASGDGENTSSIHIDKGAVNEEEKETLILIEGMSEKEIVDSLEELIKEGANINVIADKISPVSLTLNLEKFLDKKADIDTTELAKKIMPKEYTKETVDILLEHNANANVVKNRISKELRLKCYPELIKYGAFDNEDDGVDEETVKAILEEIQGNGDEELMRAFIDILGLSDQTDIALIGINAEKAEENSDPNKYIDSLEFDKRKPVEEYLRMLEDNYPAGKITDEHRNRLKERYNKQILADDELADLADLKGYLTGKELKDSVSAEERAKLPVGIKESIKICMHEKSFRRTLKEIDFEGVPLSFAKRGVYDYVYELFGGKIGLNEDKTKKVYSIDLDEQRQKKRAEMANARMKMIENRYAELGLDENGKPTGGRKKRTWKEKKDANILKIQYGGKE